MFSLLKCKSHLYWHITYFKMYVTEKICPIDLRGHIHPTIKDPTIEFKKSWENILTNCSLDLMRALITQYTLNMITLDGKIERLSIPI